jgi:mannose-6-phosphate isomerase-like protein (cupin superfamily)
MKYLAKILVAGAALAVAALFLFAADGPGVTFVGHEKVASLMDKGGSLHALPDHTASIAHRTGPGQVEVHDKETDLIYILDGEATFVTGGTMIGGKSTKAAQWLGTDIQGGETRHLSKGDFVEIPAGTPHWFKEVPQSVHYYVIKVIKP